MNHSLKVLALLGSVLLAGCGADNDYTCKIPGACAPVRMTYNNARANTGWNGWSVDGQYNASKKKKHAYLPAPGDGAVVGHLEPSGVASAVGSLEHPVYHPATPYMVWLAPYATARGHLHSSSLEWFTVPGYWEGPDGLRLGVSRKRAAPETGGWRPVLPSDTGFRSIGAAIRAHSTGGVLSGVTQPD